MTTGSGAMTVESIVERFDAGWRRPHPRAWDDILAGDFAMTQPFMIPGHGREHWHDEVGRLLWLLPDLRGRVVRWSARGEHLFVELALTATAGRRRLEFTLVDRFVLDDGRLARRTTFLDTAPVIARLALTPSLWARWWLSGLGPVTIRRRLLRPRHR